MRKRAIFNCLNLVLCCTVKHGNIAFIVYIIAARGPQERCMRLVTECVLLAITYKKISPITYRLIHLPVVIRNIIAGRVCLLQWSETMNLHTPFFSCKEILKDVTPGDTGISV